MVAQGGADTKTKDVSDAGRAVHVPDASSSCSAEVYGSLGKTNISSMLSPTDKSQAGNESCKFLDGFSVTADSGDGKAPVKKGDGVTDPKFQVHDQSLGKEDRTDVNAAMLTLNSNNNDVDKAIKYLDPNSPNFSARAAEVGQRLQAMTDKGLYDKNMVPKWDGAVAKATGKDSPTVGDTAPPVPVPANGAVGADRVAAAEPIKADGKPDQNVDPKFQVHDQSLGKEDRADVNAAMLTLNSNNNDVDKAIKYLDPNSPNFSARAAEVGQRLQAMTDKGLYDKNMVPKWDGAVAKATGKDSPTVGDTVPPPALLPAEDTAGADRVPPPVTVSATDTVGADRVPPAVPASATDTVGADRVPPAVPASATDTVGADRVPPAVPASATDTVGADRVPPAVPASATDTVGADRVPPAVPIKADGKPDQNVDPKFQVHDSTLGKEDRTDVNAAMLTLNSNNNDLDKAIKYLDPSSPNFSARAAEVGQRLQAMTDKGLYDKNMVPNWDKAVSSANSKTAGTATGDEVSVDKSKGADVPAPKVIKPERADVVTTPRPEPTAVNPDLKFRLHDTSLGKEDRMSVNSAMLTLNSNNNDFGRAVKYLDPGSPAFSERATEVGTRLEEMTKKGLFSDDMVAKWKKAVSGAGAS